MEQKFFLVVLFSPKGQSKFTIMKAEERKKIIPPNGWEIDFARQIEPEQMNALRKELVRKLPEMV